MLKLLLFSMLLLARPTPQQQPVTPALPIIPPEAMHMTSPAAPTPEGMAHAKKMFGYDCVVCHGTNGNGKGEVALESKLIMKDWTDPAVLKGRTDGELFYIITHGQGNMPSEGERAKPEDIWNMVVIARSFSKP
jgi:mono/diheme cytochrome c family protein